MNDTDVVIESRASRQASAGFPEQVSSQGFVESQRDIRDQPSRASIFRRRAERPAPMRNFINCDRLVTSVFRNRDAAERAYRSALDMGYTDREISVVMSDRSKKDYFDGSDVKTELGTKAAGGAGIGGAIGGALGALAAALAAVGTTLVLPGIGIAVAGPVAAGLAGAGAGGATGGIIGALIGWGIPEERVRHYESAIREGGILIGVRPRTDTDAGMLERQWREYDGEHISQEQLKATAWA